MRVYRFRRHGRDISPQNRPHNFMTNGNGDGGLANTQQQYQTNNNPFSQANNNNINNHPGQQRDNHQPGVSGYSKT